ncbi:MAG: type II toxin-antitoxin system VapC family toxin [Pseudomonadales bacterium]
MLVDTDVLIWNLRGNANAAALLDGRPGFALSAVTYMELIQGLRSKQEFTTLRQALAFWQATIVQVSEAVSSRACFLVEQFALSDSLAMADALVAATALERGDSLVTGNDKHYRCIDSLTVERFRP